MDKNIREINRNVEEDSGRGKSIILTLIFLLTLAVNYMTATGKLNGTTQKNVSDALNTLITPAPMAFSIWSVIYLLTFILLMLALFSKNNFYKAAVNKIFYLMSGMFILNILWNILFVYKMIGLSVLAIIAYLIVLMMINRRISHYRIFNLFKVTFGLHNGWIVCATLVNIAAYLKSVGYNYPVTREAASVIALIIVTLLSIAIAKLYRNPSFLISIAWAFLNIFINHNSGVFEGLYPTLRISSLIATIISAIGAVYVVYVQKKYGGDDSYKCYQVPEEKKTRKF